MTTTDPTAPPETELLLLEVRAIAELGAFFSMLPLLRTAPRGDGHPVLVLPGLLASDVSTLPLRSFLNDRGYAAHGWEQGRNLGPRPGVLERLRARFDELHRRHQRRVTLIGCSLGGVYARELARQAPSQARAVITLGSPFAGAPRASHAWRAYEAASGRRAGDWPDRERFKEPPPVPATAIYSRSDGIVAWQGCLERPSPTTENIEVEGSHSGLGHNPAALYAIGDRLAQPEGGWQPFDRSGLRSLLYPDPARDARRAA
jgi:pimeloyl-ACP methyl ester carboxylesterase